MSFASTSITRGERMLALIALVDVEVLQDTLRGDELGELLDAGVSAGLSHVERRKAQMTDVDESELSMCFGRHDELHVS